MRGPIVFVIIFLSICTLIVLNDIIKLFVQFNKLTRKQVITFIDRFIIIVSIIIILASLVWDFNYLKYKPAIPHKDWESIALNDFRGLKKPYQTLDGGVKFAFVSTSIKVKKRRNKIEIKSVFHPCRSYVYNRNLYSNGLLTHEMYHFHIKEYCARLMSKEIKEFDQYNVKFNLKKIKKQILVYEQSLQIQYDEETYHSYVNNKQLEWQKKIDSLLNSVENYNNSIIYLDK